MSSSYLMNLLASAAAVIVGIVIHESAHAAAAWALGDKTARSRGRVSLNPLNHIDPFGTILLPLLMLAAGGPVFAFAKPVPVYLNNLKQPEKPKMALNLYSSKLVWIILQKDSKRFQDTFFQRI